MAAVERSRHLCGETTIITLSLPDKRGPRPVPETWMFVRTLEHCLYGGSSGAVNKLFARCAKASRACPLRLTLTFTPARPSQHSRGAFPCR